MFFAVERLTKRFGGLTAVNNVSFALKREDRLAVERELVLVDRLAQPAFRARPSGESGVSPVDRIIHGEILAVCC